MELATLLAMGQFLWSPLVFALLVGAAVYLVWMALGALRAADPYAERLAGYAGAADATKVVLPRRSLIKALLRGAIHILGRFAPRRNWQQFDQLLLLAGRPGNLSVLDFLGLRLLLALVGAGALFFLGSGSQPGAVVLRNAVIAGVVGYLLPPVWLRRRARKRQNDILRALPDALDMLTIGVEAGLAFESALLRVGEKWDNALTREFRRAVGEMRVGTPRREALQRMAARVEVDEVSTFIAVLVQSNRMGISIAQVLHAQAEQMRLKRQQRAEELARQAGVKMVFPLVFFIFPSLFIVILGPIGPRMLEALNNVAGSIGGG